MVEILYKSKNAVVIYKPAGIPSQGDPTGDKDALTLTSEILRELGENSSLWIIHRLDRVVGGLLVFARNKATAAALSSLVSGDGPCKEYLAVVDGDAVSGKLVDYLFKDKMQNKAVVVSKEKAGAKRAELDCIVIDKTITPNGTKSLVRVRLVTGRFHQIRAQLSSRALPITGDKKYGSRDAFVRMPALFSYKLMMEIKGETITASQLPPCSEYPWNLFSATKYESITEEFT